MATLTPKIIVHCFAIPAHARRGADGKWRARLAVCCVPKVFGTPGSYFRVNEDLPELLSLPQRLRDAAFEVILPDGTVAQANPVAARADLWRWSGSAFVEVQAASDIPTGVRRLGEGEELPVRYDRAAVAKYLVGNGAVVKANASPFREALLSFPGIYSQFTASSLSRQPHGIDRLQLANGVLGLMEKVVENAPYAGGAVDLPSAAEASKSLSKAHERLITEFRRFHLIDEGRDVELSTSFGVRKSLQGDDANLRMAIDVSDNGRLIGLPSVHSIHIGLPSLGDVPAGFEVRVRNPRGGLLVPSNVVVDSSASWAVTGSAGWQFLEPGVTYTLSVASSKWRVAAPPVQETISASENGRIIEKDEPQGVDVLLPDFGLDPGFRATARNSGGPLSFVSGTAAVRLVPRDLGGDGVGKLEVGSGPAFQASWDGTQWNVTDDATDDEFHRCVGGLNSYPTLAREIGLVWDLEVTLPESVRMPATGLVQLVVRPGTSRLQFHPFSVAAQWSPIGNTNYAAFSPTPQNVGNPDGAMPMPLGFMDLSLCAVNQVELDVPLQSLLAQAQSRNAASRNLRRRAVSDLGLQQEREAREQFTRKGGGPANPHRLLPALSEAGIEIAHPTWHLAHQAAVKENNRLRLIAARAAAKGAAQGARLLSSPAEVLHQEILMRGCRFDVEEGGTRLVWHALCAQETLIEPASGAAAVTCRREGAITGNTTGVSTVPGSDGSVKETHRGSDVIFRWSGWGAVLPRPLSPAAKPSTASAPMGGLALRAAPVIARGSQYPLRLGHRHRFRARLVDIAGNGWSFEEATDIANASELVENLASPTIAVERYQPAKPPRFSRLTQDGGGAEEVTTFVIRSFDARPAVPAYYRAHCPRVSFELAQMTGVFDSPDLSANIWAIRQAHDRSMAVQAAIDGVFDKPAAPGQLYAKHLTHEDLHVRGIAWRFLPGLERVKGAPATELATGDATLLEGTPLISRYRISGHTASAKHPEGHVAVVVEPSQTRSSKVLGHQLFVSLPRGESQQVVVSSELDGQSLRHFGIWNATADLKDVLGLTVDGAETEARTGAASTLTPPSVVTFIHASQRPVRAPSIRADANVPLVARAFGEKHATLQMWVDTSVASTGRVDLDAQWEEFDDDQSSRRWTVSAQKANVTHWAVPSQDQDFCAPQDSSDLLTAHQNFADTRRRLVAYTATGTSRHSEFFNRLVRDEEGKERRTRGVQAPTTDQYLQDSDFQSTSATLKIDVPNSGEPPPFEIEYVIPRATVEDERGFGGEFRSRDTTRHLRVYFRRPAFLTGQGEVLGVLAAPATKEGARVGAFEDEDADAVSEMAEDPLSFSVPITPEQSQLTQEFFPQPDVPARTIKRLPVRAPARSALAGSRTTTVLGYQIHEIPGEDLLYADIRIAPTERASPFLKLAFVRYQPHSVEGAHVSNRPTFAFVRPGSDRSVNVKFGAKANPFSVRRTLTIQVHGPAPMSDDGEIGSELRIEIVRHSKSAAHTPYETTSERPMSKRWFDKSRFIAEWKFAIEVDQWRFDEGTENEQRLAGYCKAYITEYTTDIAGSGPAWFTELGLGWLKWADTPQRVG